MPLSDSVHLFTLRVSSLVQLKLNDELNCILEACLYLLRAQDLHMIIHVIL